MFLDVTSYSIFEFTKLTNSPKFLKSFNYVFLELISNKIYKITTSKSTLYFLDMASTISFGPTEPKTLEKFSFEYVFSRDSLNSQFTSINTLYTFKYFSHPCDRYM